jgi:hypothetical protein
LQLIAEEWNKLSQEEKAKFNQAGSVSVGKLQERPKKQTINKYSTEFFNSILNPLISCDDTAQLIWKNLARPQKLVILSSWPNVFSLCTV